MLQRGRSALRLRLLALEVHRNNGHCCITDVRTCLNWLRRPPSPTKLNELPKTQRRGIPAANRDWLKANDFNVGHLTTNAENIAIETCYWEEKNVDPLAGGVFSRWTWLATSISLAASE
jgi:hypothetical protein